MRARSLLLRLLVPAGLVLLVGLLATLQYRWLGQVSAAERESKQTTLRLHADEFADDFDRELARAYLGFQTNAGVLQPANWEAFARRYDTWRESARDPQILRAVYLFEGNAPGASILQYKPETRAFISVTWPDELAPIRDRVIPIHNVQVPIPNDVRNVIMFREPLIAAVPAIMIPLTNLPTKDAPVGRSVFTLGTLALGGGYVIVEFDRAYLQTTFLPALAARHFPERADDRYRFAVVDPDDRDHPIYSRGVPAGGRLDPKQADATVPIFALRLELGSQMLVRSVATTTDVATAAGATPVAGTFIAQAPSVPLLTQKGRAQTSAASVSIFVESRGRGPADQMRFTSRPDGAAWQLVLQHAAGSLDAAVTETRRRNLWLSFGILAVLGAGVGLVVMNAQRSQRLAAQQMDFVATVTHELRTPLAVIRSAAQNLSAGVVSEPAQAKRYGALIEDEGRRLTEMVEQVLEYAGLSGNRRAPHAHPVDAGAVVREVAAASDPLAEAGHVEIAVRVADRLPPVLADEDALRRALQNLVTNALKYGADGRWVEIGAERATSRGQEEVQLSVRDRGRGIDPDDLPHIFEPFYRGRYARDRQIHGNGLGLSLVQRIAEAHGGRLTVQSSPGEGATFTLHLPAAAPDVAGSEMTSGIISSPVPGK